MSWGRLTECEWLRTAARVAVAAAFAAVLLTAPVNPAMPASAAVEQWETFHGCVVTVSDDFVVIRVHGAGAGPNGLARFGLTGATSNETSLTGDACIAVVAWKEDGAWYAQSITAEKQDDGTVEVGYGIVSDQHRRGYASEAARALVGHAFARPAVRRVIAETYPELIGSIGVLRRCGFRHIGEGSEPGVIRYELTRAEFEGEPTSA